jgi:hypothetical protein
MNAWRRLEWLILATLLVAWPVGKARGGPWTKEEQHYYLQLGTAFTWADRWYDPRGNDAPISVRKNNEDKLLLNSTGTNFQQLLTNFYFEYGLLSRFTVFGDIPFLTSMRQKNPGGDRKYSVNGVGDITLGGRFALVTDPFALALELRLGLPTGDTDENIPTGSGDVRGEARVAVGKIWTFGMPSLALSGEMGFMFRGNTEIKSDLGGSLGYVQTSYAPELVLRSELDLIIPFHRLGLHQLIPNVVFDYRGSISRLPDPTTMAANTFSVIPENSRLLTVTGSVMWYVYYGFGATFRYTQALSGARLPTTSTVGGALFYEF